MPVILTKVNKGGETQKKLIKFMHCDTGLIGNTLGDKIVNPISYDFQIDPTHGGEVAKFSCKF